MKVQVTQEHIDKGEVQSLCNCPVAMALHQATGETFSVLYDWAIYGVDNRIGLDADVAGWIRAFDAYGEVQPFEFHIDWPAPARTSVPAANQNATGEPK